MVTEIIGMSKSHAVGETQIIESESQIKSFGNSFSTTQTRFITKGEVR